MHRQQMLLVFQSQTDPSYVTVNNVEFESSHWLFNRSRTRHRLCCVSHVYPPSVYDANDHKHGRPSHPRWREREDERSADSSLCTLDCSKGRRLAKCQSACRHHFHDHYRYSTIDVDEVIRYVYWSKVIDIHRSRSDTTKDAPLDERARSETCMFTYLLVLRSRARCARNLFPVHMSPRP